MRMAGAALAAAWITLAAGCADPRISGPSPVVPCEGEAQGYECSGVDLLSVVSIARLGGAEGTELSDLWGWTDPSTGREYALVGRTDGTVFVDVTDPTDPQVVGELPLTPGAQPSKWRDVKVYADHAFIVADNAGAHGMQVFDLRRLRGATNTPVTFDADAVYRNIASAHNIVIDTVAGMAVATGANRGGETCGGGLHMIDISTPQSPAFAGCFNDPATGSFGNGYTHDAQCVTYTGPDTRYAGRRICFGSNVTTLSIADVSDPAQPTALSSAGYPGVAYMHQGWLTDDQRYFFSDDESDEFIEGRPTRTLIWDVSDLEDPVFLSEYLGTTRATDHNLYVRGDRVYQANYTSGLRVLDISTPRSPTEIAFFDVLPGTNEPGFFGAWSVYPFFRSGTLVVSSINEGLFVLRLQEALQ